MIRGTGYVTNGGNTSGIYFCQTQGPCSSTPTVAGCAWITFSGCNTFSSTASLKVSVDTSVATAFTSYTLTTYANPNSCTGRSNSSTIPYQNCTSDGDGDSAIISNRSNNLVYVCVTENSATCTGGDCVWVRLGQCLGGLIVSSANVLSWSLLAAGILVIYLF